MPMHMQEEDLIRMNKVLRHRLRNSASGLKASITFLAKELAGRLAPRELEYFPLIQQECDAITAITNRMQLMFDPVRLSSALPMTEIMESVSRIMHEEFPTTAFFLENEAGEGPMVSEKDALFIPLCEVLRNAAEAAPGEAVRIHIQAPAAGALTITVSDSGSGFSASDDPFLPFLTTKTRHLGLGLTIARKYMEYIGGTITYTREGDRTDVTLAFPARQTVDS